MAATKVSGADLNKLKLDSEPLGCLEPAAGTSIAYSKYLKRSDRKHGRSQSILDSKHHFSKVLDTLSGGLFVFLAFFKSIHFEVPGSVDFKTISPMFMGDDGVASSGTVTDVSPRATVR